MSTATAVALAGCTSSSDGNGTPPTRATVTSTTTATATSAAPPTGSGVPASGSATSSGGGSGPGLCTPTVMTFSVGQVEGAAGTTSFPVHAVNASQSPCVTTGFPGVAFLDSSGQQVVQATRATQVPVTTITVAPGQEVTASVDATDVPTGNASCTQSPAILFTLPDNTDPTKLTIATTVCAGSVRALVAGDGS